MDSSLILPLITGSGVAGVFCVLFVLGLVYPRAVITDLKAENHELKQELEAQRGRADTAVAAAAATRDILSAIQLGQSLGHGREAT
jgi:Tfp pilus assembly protein PilN